MNLREWLKWKIAGDEMAELERRKTLHDQYRQWFAEFPDVALMLDNVWADLGHIQEPGQRILGPMDLREKMRALRFSGRLDTATLAASIDRARAVLTPGERKEVRSLVSRIRNARDQAKLEVRMAALLDRLDVILAGGGDRGATLKNLQLAARKYANRIDGVGPDVGYGSVAEMDLASAYRVFKAAIERAEQR